MASPENIRNDYDSTPLDALERELVRSALNISGEIGGAIYLDSEARMDALSPSQCQIMRKLLNVDLTAVDEDRDTKIFGASDGTYFNPDDRDNWVQREMRRMLYPSAATNDPTNAASSAQASSISYIPAQYASGTTEYD